MKGRPMCLRHYSIQQCCVSICFRKKRTHLVYWKFQDIVLSKGLTLTFQFTYQCENKILYKLTEGCTHQQFVMSLLSVISIPRGLRTEEEQTLKHLNDKLTK